MSRSLHLSKSRFLAGTQCEKRLWLEVHRRSLATPPSAVQQAVFSRGTEIGERARGLWPGGVLVEESYRRHAAACERTHGLLEDESVPALFEAAFEHRGVRVRADVLERLPGARWRLVEVKSSTKVKAEHIDDLAVQRFVLESAGLAVAEAALLHLNRAYERGADGIDWQRLFHQEDLTARVAARLAGIGGRVDEMHAILARREAPGVAPGPHCTRPHACFFWDHCTRAKPADWVFRLPDKGRHLARLEAAGIERISEIPGDWPLEGRAANARAAVQSGEPYFSAALQEALAGFGPPAHYLDFEAMAPAIPHYPGTRPYEAIPFQWSLHHANGAGEVTHCGFLADGAEDPRPSVAETLLAALEESDDPIVVYSPYESRMLSALASWLPELATRLQALEARLCDLLPVVRGHVYHADFAGSFSIKNVAPALVRDVTYAGLDDVASGQDAQLIIERLVAGTVDGEESARLRQALEIYCARDTEALLALHRVLRAAD